MSNFRKIFFLTFLFITFINDHTYSEEVKKIEVNGNERISAETIMIFGDIALGKDYQTSDLNSLIKKLYETTFFSDISVKIENNVLFIDVKENPIINSIVFDGEKASKYTEKILELVALRENGSFVENNVKSDIN